jgi:outer membrane protein assembly factor BamA
MAIDRGAFVRGLARLVAVALGSPLSAQTSARSEGASLLLINEDTRIGGLEFRFSGSQSVPESRLQEQVALTGPGKLAPIRNLFAWLPFISSTPLAPFDPIDLQKDKVRLTRLYHREGFPQVAIEYQVALDSAENTVDVAFVIDEGPPLILRNLDVIGRDRDTVMLEPDLRDPWSRFIGQTRTVIGERLSEALETRLRSETLEWLRDHEHAFASLSVTRQVDSAASAARLVIRVDPGPRTRVGRVQVEGNRAISDRTIRRELPFRSGDPFRSSQLGEGQRQLFGLDLVRVALVDVASNQPHDSTADIRVRVEEGSLRAIEGQVGRTWTKTDPRGDRLP